MGNFLRSTLAAGQFFYSAELVLGRDHDAPEAEAFVRDASREPNGVKVISATDLPGGSPALPPEAFASYVAEHGLTPIVHLSGKDGNRSLLEGRLHALARMGVENVLALTGDVHRHAFGGKPKPVYDLDSVLILSLVTEMRRGLRYRQGTRTLRSAPFDFLAGAVVNPYKIREPDQMMQYYKLELKVAAGSRFIIPQLGYNLRKLYELRQYMAREGIGHVPVIANVYVPTAAIARSMQCGKISGCVVTDDLVRRLEREKKPERLERAALMVAAVRGLGFSGAHIGGAGLTHKDLMKIIHAAEEIGEGWRRRVDELVFECPGEFYLFPQGADGLSDADGPYQTSQTKPRLSWKQRFARISHKTLVSQSSLGARFLASRLGVGDGLPSNDSWRHGKWYRVLGLSNAYRKSMLACQMCGDCVADHLDYAGCPMASCYKKLRNGPCGGSRPDGTCEADPRQPCVWNLAYESVLAGGGSPKRFARTLVPPRDWALNGTNPLANRLAGIDNYSKRRTVRPDGEVTR